MTEREEIFEVLESTCSMCGHIPPPRVNGATLTIRKLRKKGGAISKPTGMQYHQWVGRAYANVMRNQLKKEPLEYALWCRNCILIEAADENTRKATIKARPADYGKPLRIWWASPDFSFRQVMEMNRSFLSNKQDKGEVVVITYNTDPKVYGYQTGSVDPIANSLKEYCEAHGVQMGEFLRSGDANRWEGIREPEED